MLWDDDAARVGGAPISVGCAGDLDRVVNEGKNRDETPQNHDFHPAASQHAASQHAASQHTASQHAASQHEDSQLDGSDTPHPYADEPKTVNGTPYRKNFVRDQIRARKSAKQAHPAETPVKGPVIALVPEEVPEPIQPRQSPAERDSERVAGISRRTLPSEMDPSKKGTNWKAPTPQSEWRPTWKGRKREPGTCGNPSSEKMKREVAEVERRLGITKSVRLPINRDEAGRPVRDEALADAVMSCMSSGMTMVDVAKQLGATNSWIMDWINRTPGLRERFDEARRRGADVIADEALEIASTPMLLEDVIESYDGEGNLMRRDVKTSDAVAARKLAVNTRTFLLSKWAPDKYGEKVEITRGTSDDQAILAARARIRAERLSGDEE